MQKQKTYKELLDGMSYRELGYTGAPSVTDPKLKAFNDTILKNDEISQTKINTTPIFKGQRRANATVQTVGGTSSVETPTAAPVAETALTTNNTYADFTKWAQEHGVDADKVFQDAMALARTQYEQSRATYGLQAEQLAQAGLTNSGVSDNMERVAYAQKVQAEQAALGQKAALEQANKEGFASYQAEQEQKQQQYNNAYLQLLSGYTDEEGNIHAPVSHEMAVAQLKYAGLNDETMISNAQKAYGDYKTVEDAENTTAQNAIGGIDATTGGFSADSIFGKLFSGDMDSEDFLDTVAKDYGIQAATDEEAVEALYQAKKISKEQRSIFYRNLASNTLEAISQAGISAKEMLKKDDNELFNAINSAYSAYKEGKMTKADWDAFRTGLMSERSPVHLAVEKQYGDDSLVFDIQIGSSEFSVGVLRGDGVRNDQEKSNTLDRLANGMNIVMYDGDLYIKSSEAFGRDSIWVRVGKVSGTARQNFKQMLKLLAEQ